MTNVVIARAQNIVHHIFCERQICTHCARTTFAAYRFVCAARQMQILESRPDIVRHILALEGGANKARARARYHRALPSLLMRLISVVRARVWDTHTHLARDMSIAALPGCEVTTIVEESCCSRRRRRCCCC